MAMPKCYIFDIDGTLAITNKNRLKYIKLMEGSPIRVKGIGSCTIKSINTRGGLVDVISEDQELKRVEAFDIRFTKNWDLFNYGCNADECNENVASIARDLHKLGYGIVISTGRSDKFRSITESWLKFNRINHNALLMRKEGDERSDFLIKQEHLESIASEYDVVGVFDDRDRVVEMWRSKELQCFQVAKGEY